jgi:hypothetical protein
MNEEKINDIYTYLRIFAWLIKLFSNIGIEIRISVDYFSSYKLSYSGFRVQKEKV